jgi:hypothetical protein
MFAVTASVMVGTIVPAVAQTDAPAPTSTTAPASTAPTAPTAPMLDPEAPRVAIEVARDARQLDRLVDRTAIAQQQLASAEAALAETEAKLATNQTKLDDVRGRVRQQAALQYRRGSDSGTVPLDVHKVDDLGSGLHYAEAALQVDQGELSKLIDTQQKLDAVRADQGQRRDEATTNAQLLVDTSAQLLAEIQRQQSQLDAWGAVPVMGASWLTGAQLGAWYRSTGANPQLAPGTTIDDITNLFVIEGNAEHVRGDLAFAQAIIETGGFSVAAGNNYSGIGVCDSCTGGYAFVSPIEGVRAQIQLLRNYADPDSRASNLASVPSPSLYGTDPRKAASLYDSFFLKGHAPLWNQMGNGNWATDPTYSGKVINLFAQMVAFAASHP